MSTTPIIAYPIDARVAALHGLQTAGVTEAELRLIGDPKVAEAIADLLQRRATTATVRPENMQVFHEILEYVYGLLRDPLVPFAVVRQHLVNDLLAWYNHEVSQRNRELLRRLVVNDEKPRELADEFETASKRISQIRSQNLNKLKKKLESAITAHANSLVSDNVLDRPVETLDLSGRAINCLIRIRGRSHGVQVHTIRDLINCTADDLMRITGFGDASLNEVQTRLGEMGLRLRS